jgi:hypothetical protein
LRVAVAWNLPTRHRPSDMFSTVMIGAIAL